MCDKFFTPSAKNSIDKILRSYLDFIPDIK